uniref:Eukaryotic translation initiation factor 5 n=1 Tax=Hirondellea gigas TaxID=1518452 RepID=A0A6A7G5R4_9CRUS
MINIGGDKNDASYRYKMPRLATKIEGRGNGIKTLIVNMTDVAKALQIHPQYTTKYFGIELGAQSKFEKKTDRAIVNGAHDAPDLAVILEKFIEGFILCQRCRLPELTMNVDVKRERITSDCASCGWSGPLGVGHRLSTFILKHPPAGQKGKKGAESKQDRKARKLAERHQNPKVSTTSSQKLPNDPETIEWHTNPSKEASILRREEEMKSMGVAQALTGGDDDVKSTRKTKKTGARKASPHEILREMLENDETTVSDLTSEVQRLEIARGFDRQKRMKIIFEAMFDVFDPKQIVSQIKRRKIFLAKYSVEKADASVFISSLEEMIGISNPKLLKRTPIIFQELYDCDILDEEQILNWHQSAPESSWIVDVQTAKEIREECQPFIDWLQSADSDDSDGSDDD